jgi:hypothetical protein
MIQKKTWVLLIIFIIILSLAVFIDNTPSITSSLRTPTPTVFLKLFPGWSVENLASLQLSDGKMQTLVGLANINDNTWEFSPPQALGVDQGKVQNLLSSLLSLEILNTLNASSTLAQYGLLSPNWIITLQNTQGETKLMKIGSETTTASGYYVQVDDDPPAVISKYGIEGILQLFSPEGLILQTPTLPPTPGTQTPP